VVVFAAASTRAVVEEIGRQFQEQTGVDVEIVPGPSSGLAKQILQGSDAELFLSADQANADLVAKETLVAERRNLLANRLVVIVPADSGLKLEALTGLAEASVGRIAVGDAKVPVGEYARQAFRSAGILEQVQDRFVGAVDVKAVVQFVSRGEVDAGIVYHTDAIASAKVRVAFEIDASQHEPIVYPLVLLRQDEIDPGAKAFFRYLGSEEAAQVFRKAGFSMADEADG
jgi:molybdate transport system substrate-binding protein